MLKKLALAAALVLGFHTMTPPPSAHAEPATWSAFDRHVDDSGNITLPSDFASWMHVGTWTVVEDNLAADLHSVYIPHEIVAHFQEHQNFPDGAMMVKEVRRHAPEEITAAADAGDEEAEAGAESEPGPSEDALQKRGEKVYKRCLSCHKLAPGKHGNGPSLAGIFGRKAGSAEGYGFSDAMATSGVVWNEETLDAHLTDVEGFIPGNRMAKVFPAGVSRAEDRRAVIDYLRDK